MQSVLCPSVVLIFAVKPLAAVGCGVELKVDIGGLLQSCSRNCNTVSPSYVTMHPGARQKWPHKTEGGLSSGEGEV